MSFTTKRSKLTEPDAPDFISALPNEVLSSILSLVPVKDAARTSVLSSRWRHLWKEAPLRLDDASIEPDELTLVFNKLEWSRKAVSKIILGSHGPIESLRLSRFTKPKLFPEMDRILESATQKGLRKLTLLANFDYKNHYVLPRSLLCCNSLHQLSLGGCEFPEELSLPVSIFPNLKELRLAKVSLSNDSLQMLLSGCRSLETLHFISFGGLCITISSPSLRNLVWDSSVVVQELIIKDVPNLESLMFSEHTTALCKVKVLNAPKLQLLGPLRMDFRALQLGSTFFDRQAERYRWPIGQSCVKVKASPCQMKRLSSVKTLAIKMEPSLNRRVPDILRCFPCLENLYIRKGEGSLSGNRNYSDLGTWDEQGSLSFLDHLKTVTVKGFYDDRSDVELVRYLVFHGNKLRKITLLCSKQTFSNTTGMEQDFLIAGTGADGDAAAEHED
ncbi:hypothetical protein LUZ61_019991 [Rhynchospora tenuis]|uniref:F-box domain-containing protein n=1 Tax=Rhynchospora tenuis TaxID=198213 RepID=A0AAD6ENF3_9POAL|nr:hypothetical protein LUZ61_019991 [Rhynchospora tenuis]